MSEIFEKMYTADKNIKNDLVGIFYDPENINAPTTSDSIMIYQEFWCNVYTSYIFKRLYINSIS